MIYLFLDADEYLFSRRVAVLKAALGDPEMADLNMSTVEGNRTDVAEILYLAGTMPFLAERRLLVVNGFLAQLDKRMAASKGTDGAAYAEAARLMTELHSAPETCDILFVDAGVDKRRHLWKGFSQGKGEDEHKIAGLADLIKDKLIVHEELATPDPKQLPGWISRYAKDAKIEIEGQAVQMLANFVGADLRRLESELQKLAAYASGRRITAADVQAMVSDASEALIWDLTDALSQRNGRKAMQALYELRRGDANPFYLLTMMARQYRILIKVKDASGAGGGNEFDIAKQVGESPYPVKKAMQQARAYRMKELEAIMDRLLRADFAMKTGADAETEIDVLVAELTQRN
ncbi:MAG: DNA polymerase III subunit delta [Caldilineaceae bacterium]